MSERFLVTGALGCIGSWACRQLVREGADVIALDAGGSDHRLRQILEPDELAGLARVDCDITDLARLSPIVAGGVTHVVHLAALQVPFCRANPSLGASVNVVGTVNVFEAVKAAGGLAGPVVFASSVAAYDEVDEGGADPSGHARTFYGVYKLANEGSARVHHADDGISSVGLRPFVVYGVGRDQGITSSPTFAMLAAAAGRPFSISYGGGSHLQLAEDTAACFIAAARSSFTGAGVYNLGGSEVEMTDVVSAIRAVEPAAAIEIAGPPLPFPAHVDAAPFARDVADVAWTSLEDGVRDTVTRFRALIERGALDLDALLP